MPPAELRGVQLYISDNGGVHLHLHRHSAGEAEQLAAALGLGRVPDSAVPLDDEQDAGWAVEWSALSYCFGGVTLTCYTDVLPGAAAEGGGPR